MSEKDDMGEEMEEPSCSELHCPYCERTFRHRKSLIYHVDYRCKERSDDNATPTTGRRRPVAAPVLKLKILVDEEADKILESIESGYARWWVVRR